MVTVSISENPGPRAEQQAVEIEFAGAIVRGHAWPGDANWVVLLHEPGGDLDGWGAVPAAISSGGYAVLAVDLPGHGLSDDPWALSRIPELVHVLAAFALVAGAKRVFVVAPREIAPAAMLARNIDALVALSPLPFPFDGPDKTPPALILMGGSDARVAELANAFFRQTRGWAVISSFGTGEQGTALFQSAWSQHALEQTLGFLRDYRVPFRENASR